MNDIDIDLAESTLQETEMTIAAVTPDELDLPTPCSNYDVADLVNHIVGWARNFAARFSGVPGSEDPNDYRSGDDPAIEFRVAAETIVGAYRADAEATKQLPVGFMVMEFLAHGWDLAAAIGRPVNFSADAAELGLQTARSMLKPESRGSAFLPEYEAPPTASSVERLVAFLGRNPNWQPTT